VYIGNEKVKTVTEKYIENLLFASTQHTGTHSTQLQGGTEAVPVQQPITVVSV